MTFLPQLEKSNSAGVKRSYLAILRKKSLNCEINSRNYLFLSFIKWWKQASLKCSQSVNLKIQLLCQWQYSTRKP